MEGTGPEAGAQLLPQGRACGKWGAGWEAAAVRTDSDAEGRAEPRVLPVGLDLGPSWDSRKPGDTGCLALLAARAAPAPASAAQVRRERAQEDGAESNATPTSPAPPGPP